MRNSVSYLKIVQAFMATNGPDFSLEVVIYGGIESTCDCCGYRGLKNQYHIKNGTNQHFVIGSECVNFVIPVRKDLPAAAVRDLTWDQMELMASMFNMSVDVTWTLVEFASTILTTRRKQANSAGHKSRIAKYGASYKPVTAPCVALVHVPQAANG